ncbi:Zn(2)-Cys(6) zinc finger domain protein [Metarhizium robertsii]|uniref:Zn(2)-C6 fungal-type domain-containing protein n=2 Tax=Metarhizium robertsii TaxID=568076 RepID=E9FCJ3_METRA|nr:uncharacterized protein MAA_09992 [Metarhizium robertsii ARSEF 23]EFY94559.1 hypothetical protein MAA_09992 [Metarhizium robertsii ARSEF 23]EXU95587.1 Zn(2)-Cys(6) zinc finger domain protein [Metarhizium robertsii]
MPSTTFHSSARLQRPLACVTCQRRKKKCDHEFPCSNCRKRGVICVPSTPAPPRKRKQFKKELFERLARVERLLEGLPCGPCQTLQAETNKSLCTAQGWSGDGLTRPKTPKPGAACRDHGVQTDDCNHGQGKTSTI